MTPSSDNHSDESNNSGKPASHEAGALARWGLIGGGIAGAVIGSFWDASLVGLFMLGSVCWVTGAFIDRARR